MFRLGQMAQSNVNLVVSMHQTIDYKFSIYCFSAKHKALKIKRKYWLPRNQDNVCQSGVTCPPADCCFNEVTL